MNKEQKIKELMGTLEEEMAQQKLEYDLNNQCNTAFYSELDMISENVLKEKAKEEFGESADLKNINVMYVYAYDGTTGDAVFTYKLTYRHLIVLPSKDLYESLKKEIINFYKKIYDNMQIIFILNHKTSEWFCGEFPIYDYIPKGYKRDYKDVDMCLAGFTNGIQDIKVYHRGGEDDIVSAFERGC